MTTMFDKFFGVPHHVIRTGTWSEMKPTEQSLYICLLHESERCCNRQLVRTDAQMQDLTRLSSRSFCNARKKLQERRLVLCERGSGNVYVYRLCNPETGKPWPGDPKRRIPYVKKSKPDQPAEITSNHRRTTFGTGGTGLRAAGTAGADQAKGQSDTDSHGLPLSF